MVTLHVRDVEFHTILAALRYYQEHGQCDSTQRSEPIEDIATNCGEVAALDAASIDDLCQRINLGIAVPAEEDSADTADPFCTVTGVA